MDKKLLSAIPRPKVKKQFDKFIKTTPQMSYLLTASQQEIAGRDTLIINFFRKDNNVMIPAFRTFCQDDDYISQDLTTKKTVWKMGDIAFLIRHFGCVYRRSQIIVLATVKDRGAILKFARKFRARNHLKNCYLSPHADEALHYLEQYQNTVKEWRLQKKHAGEIAEIDAQMVKFGDLPDDYQRFVEETVFSDANYIFYNRKKARAFCTSCKHEIALTKDGRMPAFGEGSGQAVRHNNTARCPFCGKDLLCKSEGRGRKNLYTVRWSVLVQKYKKEVLVRYFCHTKDFLSDFRKPLVWSREKIRTVHDAERSVDFEWTKFKMSREIRWCYYKASAWYPSALDFPRNVFLYNPALAETISGTCMQYSVIDIYLEKVIRDCRPLKNPWTLDWYFNDYRKMPYIEQLLKIGFFKMTEDVLENQRSSPLENGKNILEILSLNREQFNMLRRLGDPSLRDRNILVYAWDTLGRISEKDFQLLHSETDSFYARNYERYIKLMRYTTLHKIKKYLVEQKINDIGLYADYAGWMEEMGYDMRNKYNLYPRSFTKAHDQKSKEYISFKDKQKKEQRECFDRLLNKLQADSSMQGLLNFHKNGLFIRLPHELEELKREGECLGHCVGSYIDRVAEKKTLIFFIRKESEPDKPYFTLEWKGAVIQCYGYNHSIPSAEIREFTDLFSKRMEEFTRKSNDLWNAA